MRDIIIVEDYLMKYLFFLIMPAMLVSCAPSIKIVEKMNYPVPFEFTIVDTVNSTKDELYVRAHEWISKTYGSAKTVIDMQDKEAGKLIGKCLITTIPNTYTAGKTIVPAEVSYIMSIDVKEGKYRCVISNFDHTGGTYMTYNPLVNAPIVNTAINYGDLQKDKITYKSSSTGKMMESQKYYEVKNYVMKYCLTLEADLKEKMHKRGDEF